MVIKEITWYVGEELPGSHHCECGDFEPGYLIVNRDAQVCKNCGGYKTGLELFFEEANKMLDELKE